MSTSAAPAAAATASKAPTVAELEAANAKLQSQIDALKDKLGITAQEKKEEEARVKEMFDFFDRDKSGFIDKEEFELLAYQAGVSLDKLTPSALEAAFKIVNPKGDGKVTFDDFLKWVRAESVKGSKAAPGLASLRLRLQSKAWMKNLKGLKKDDKKTASTSAASSSASSSSSSSSTSSVTAKATSSSDEKKSSASAAPAAADDGLVFKAALGEFDKAKGGIYFDAYTSEEQTKQVRSEVNAADGVKLFAFIDFALNNDYKEDEAAELAGIIDTVFGTIPWQAMPIPVYDSHSVDVADGENGGKVLRISIFSAIDPDEMFKQMAGIEDENNKISIGDFIKGSIKVEVPFDVQDVAGDNFRFSEDTIKGRASVQLGMNDETKTKAAALVDNLPPQLKKMVKMQLVVANFVKAISVNLQLSDFAEFLKDAPAAAAAGAGNRRYARRSAIDNLRGGLGEISQIPVGMFIKKGASKIPKLLGKAPQEFRDTLKQTYGLVTNNLAGLRRIQIHNGNHIMKLAFAGLDFVYLLPKLDKNASGSNNEDDD